MQIPVAQGRSLEREYSSAATIAGGDVPQLHLQAVRRQDRVLRRLQSGDHRRLLHGGVGASGSER